MALNVSATATVIVAVLSAVGGSILTVLWQAWKERRTVLSYRVSLDEPILSVRHAVKGGVQVIYAGREVKNLSLAVVEFKNSGPRDIVPEEFEAPLMVTANGSAEVLQSELEGEGVAPHSKPLVDGKVVKISPMLLKASEAIRLRLLLDGKYDLAIQPPRVRNVRIAEGPHPDLLRKRLFRRSVMFTVAMVLLAIGAGVSLLYPSGVLTIALASGGILCGFVAMALIARSEHE